MKDVTQKSAMRILKMANCPTVSAKSTLTYHLGCDEAGEIHLRIHTNSAKGMFSQEWVALSMIEDVLATSPKPFTSFALKPMFRGKSQNNPAFLLAVLLHEGLAHPGVAKKRCYETGDFARFKQRVQGWIDAGVALGADDKPEKGGKKSESGAKAKADGKNQGKSDTSNAKPQKAKGVEASNAVGSDVDADDENEREPESDSLPGS